VRARGEEAGGLLALRVKKKGKRAEEKKDRLGRRKKGEGEEGFGFSFFFFFKFFSNFANFTQTIKPCIQIMMHKHLLFLTLLK
jgi:hypothetical protein